MNKTKKSYNNPSQQIKINIWLYFVFPNVNLARPTHGEVNYKQDIYYNVNIKINNNSMQEVKLQFR